jgi:pyruvate formate lyase activating enzyme
MKETLLYEKNEDKGTRCLICQRRCTIDSGEYGYCHTRYNREGTLFSLAYGQVSSLSYAPIEAKPLFHFYPGSLWLSMGTLGCNFLCPGCQNHEIAHDEFVYHPDSEQCQTRYIPPEKLVELALVRLAQKRAGTGSSLRGLSFTYNEPAVWFEYSLDCARLAKKEGLLINWVTNGFLTKQALDEIGPLLDAYRVDIKGFSPATYEKTAHISRFEGILDVTERAKKKWRHHVEIVTNIIPKWNDDVEGLESIARWIVRSLGPDTPWHVTRFVPRHELSNIEPTPLKTLERARRIGLDCGLRYVYIGNVPGHPAQHTLCPECGLLLVERDRFTVRSLVLKEGVCPECKTRIPGRWK